MKYYVMCISICVVPQSRGNCLIMLTYYDIHENPSCLKSVYFQTQCNNSCSLLQDREQLCCTVNIPERVWKSKSHQISMLTQHSSTCPRQRAVSWQERSPYRLQIIVPQNQTHFLLGPGRSFYFFFIIIVIIIKKGPKSLVEIQFLIQSWSWQHASPQDWSQRPWDTRVVLRFNLAAYSVSLARFVTPFIFLKNISIERSNRPPLLHNLTLYYKVFFLIIESFSRSFIPLSKIGFDCHKAPILHDWVLKTMELSVQALAFISLHS